MRLCLLLIIVFSTLSHISFSQTVKIMEEATKKPISEVFIYHENKENITYSDETGKADISSFPSGLIFFQHPSFHTKSVAYLENNLRVTLKEKIMQFNEVVVSANKWEQKEESISQQIMSINKKTIQFQNPQTSADLLANSGQVFVQKSQLGGGSPKIRGFSANSVLLVVDGVRMNNAIFRSGNLQNVINIDANALESSEVIFGPGSVIYGSDAMGGVMDFHTIDPKWSSDDITDFSANSLLRYSSAANEQTGHIDFSISKRKFTFFHSTTVTSFDDLRTGGNRWGDYKGEFERKFYAKRINGVDQLVPNNNINIQKFSGYNLFNTISKAKVRLNDKIDIGYGFYYSTTSDIPRYDNLTETIAGSDSLEAAEWYYGPQDWQMHNLELNFYNENPLFDQARATLAYQLFEESRNDRNFGDDRLRTRIESVDMYSMALDFDKEFDRSNLYYGIDFFHNDVQSDAFRRNIDTGVITNTTSRYPNEGSDYTSFALYGSYVHRLSTQVVLNTGLRYNKISLSGSTSDSLAIAAGAASIDLNNNALNGSLGLAINLDEKNKISYNIATGFRSPNIDDVGKIFEKGDQQVVPNPNLKPEYSLSNELSYEHKTDKSLFRIVGFYSRLFDAIIDGPFTLNGSATFDVDQETLNIVSKVNTGAAELYGGSLLFQTEIGDNWALTKTITYTGGQDITNDEPLRHTTPVFGRLAVTYQKSKLRSELFVDYNGARKRGNIPPTEFDKSFLYTANGSPAWFTLNLKSSYQLSEHLNINIGLENILDMHYRPYSSGISAPGRNFIIALRGNI